MAVTEADRPIEVLRQLAAIRTTIRRRLGVYGVCAVLSGGCLSLLTIVTIDWLLEMPPGLRAFGAVLFVVGFGLALLRWVVGPLQTKLTLAQVAGRVEQHFGGMDDRLTSTVSFLTTANDASRSLMGRVITNTDQVVSVMPLNAALARGPMVKQAVLLGLSLVVMATILVGIPGWLTLGVRRYARPFGGLQWPHRVHIQPLTGDLTVPVGESITVRMRVTQGGAPDLRGIVHVRDGLADGARGSFQATGARAVERETVLAMHRDGADGYRCTVDGVSADAIYWFEAGDDSTRSRASRIRVVRRPEVTRMTAGVRPPPYAVGSRTVEYDLMTGPATAVPGSVVALVIRASKPVRVLSDDDSGAADGALPAVDGALPAADGDTDRRVIDTDGVPLRAEARLILNPEENENDVVPLAYAGTDPRDLIGRLTIERETTFRVDLTDRDGLVNLGGPTYVIHAAPDSPPVVRILEPKALTESTPRGSVLIRARAEDDIGLTQLRLVARRAHPAAASPSAGGVVDGAFETVLADDSSSLGVSFDVEHPWDIASLNLEPPTVVLFHVEATDNCTHGGPMGQVGASAEMRLHIVSEGQFEARVREQFVVLQRQIREALLHQQGLLEESRDAAEALSESASMAAAGRGVLTDLARRQSGDARALEEHSRRVTALAETIERNLSEDQASAGLLRGAAVDLAALSDGPMNSAATGLQRAADSPEGPAAAMELKEAMESQAITVARLGDVLRRLDVWGDFQAYVLRTRELLDRQERLEARTADMGRRTVGRRIDELTATEPSTLRRLEHEQRQLSEDLEGLLKRLAAEADAAAKDDPAQTASIQSALRAAAVAEVVERMQRAASAIHDNRLTGASMDQRQAQRGLSKMLAGLETREIRRLAELAKRLEEADQAVAELLVQQATLTEATREAVTTQADRAVLFDLSTDQGRLRGNAEALGRDFSDAEATADVGDTVRQSADAMRRAAAALVDGLGQDALAPQSVAVEQLRQALAVLEERAWRAAHAASQKMMAAARVQLEEIREAQTAINEGSTQVAEAIERQGRLTRESARRASALASGQVKAEESTRSVRQELTGAVVYNLVLDQVMTDMGVSRESLHRRRFDASLAAVQGRIGRRLDQLIRSLREAASLPPSDEFVDTPGGGGQATSAARATIPTAAELIMLKTMQDELLTRTMELDSSVSPEGQPSEEDLRAARTLGEEQRVLRELTEAMVREAQKGH